MKTLNFLTLLLLTAFASAVHAQTDYKIPSIKSVKGKNFQLPAFRINSINNGTFWLDHPNNYSGIYGTGIIGISNKKITIINLSSGEITFEYSLSNFTNNDIQVLSPEEGITGFSAVNDTLVFYNNSTENITLAKLTNNGITFINQYDLSKEQTDEWHQNWTLFSQSGYEPLFIGNSINVFRGSYSHSTTEPTFYEFSHNWQFNVSNNPSIGLSNISNYPNRYKQGFFGMMFIPQRVFNQNKGQLTYAYPADPEMQIFSFENNSSISANVRSFFQRNEIPFITKGEKLGSESKFKDIFIRDQYTHLIYDSYNHLYYRFLRLGQEVISDSTCTWCIYKKPLVVMILDENLTVLDEILFENPMYNELNSFAGPEGLYLACTGWNNNESRLKYSTYDILKWSDSNTIKSPQIPSFKCYIKDGLLKLTEIDHNLSETKLIVTICNTSGVWVLREIITDNGIDVSSLSKGLYLVRISGSNWSSVQKIEIN